MKLKDDEAYYLRINDREGIYLLPPAIIMAIFGIILIVLNETGILNMW